MNTHIKSIWRAFVFVVVPLFVAPLAYAADDLAAPVILVATERLLGLPYEETVLLAVPAGDGQHLGLIVNRPTTIELASVFPDAASVRRSMDRLFFGGPALSGVLFAAVRAPVPPSDFSIALMPGLFLVTDKDGIERLIKATPNKARYFTGYVVWGAGELADEIRSGMWNVKPGESGILFRANPQQLWIEFAQPKRQVASLGHPNDF